jgi:glycosyltransferase involved in cell wall biosynthesis
MAPADPVVSVVLPVYNGARTVGRAIDSILGQGLADLEVLVVNDGSTDSTADVLAARGDPRMRILTQENLGLVAALNRGIAAARGRYVARMDADDEALPQRLERQVAFLRSSAAPPGSCILTARRGSGGGRRTPRASGATSSGSVPSSTAR